MRRKLFILTLLVSIYTNAQRETYNWFFGDNAGIQFSDDNTVTSVVGALSTTEGCASISNGDGDEPDDQVQVTDAGHELLER